jgi:peptidyl-prolyl cis-trans isomerase B (cyclophilin B)
MSRRLDFKTYRNWAICWVAIALVLSSCTGATAPTTDAASPAATEGAAASPAAEVTAGLPRLQGKATVELTVKGKPIVIEVNGDQAPVTAGNFVDLVERGVYNGTVFHRVVRDPEPFVVQGGDPQSKDPNVPASQLGTGSFVDPQTNQPRYLPLEIQPADGEAPLYSQPFDGATRAPALRHTRGAVAMARSQSPDSASAQFYIALADLPFLDGNYAVFGYVTQGMDVVESIQQGDRLESAKVTEGAENLVQPAAASETPSP